MRDLDAQYRVRTGYDLLMQADQVPELLEKPYKSFIEKTFRKNILDNKKWPDPPPGGWVLPDNWFLRVNDIVRTCFVVKYLDGVQFLIDSTKHLAIEGGLRCRDHFEARAEGYYAAHLYVTCDFEIPAPEWDTLHAMISVELQVTTQLQEVIRKLLHTYYESRRTSGGKDDMKWQWDFGSNEFAAAYLGHILHYVEGMVMDIRDKQRKEWAVNA